VLQELSLTNHGIILDDIPSELFSKIKEEVEFVETSNKPMISGLTAKGVPKHYFMNQGYQKEFLEYIMHLKDVYLNIYPDYLSEFKIMTHNVPFSCGNPWFNIQKRTEFIPIHTHDGVISYSAWIKIPYDVEEETKDEKYTSCFQFNYTTITGSKRSRLIKIDKSFEGKIMMFPSDLLHRVYPFYGVNDSRISLSGNILFDTEKYKI
jgi:hypothetical protein